jgi:hypothetical protein
MSHPIITVLYSSNGDIYSSFRIDPTNTYSYDWLYRSYFDNNNNQLYTVAASALGSHIIKVNYADPPSVIANYYIGN